MGIILWTNKKRERRERIRKRGGTLFLEAAECWKIHVFPRHMLKSKNFGVRRSLIDKGLSLLLFLLELFAFQFSPGTKRPKNKDVAARHCVRVEKRDTKRWNREDEGIMKRLPQEERRQRSRWNVTLELTSCSLTWLCRPTNGHLAARVTEQKQNLFWHSLHMFSKGEEVWTILYDGEADERHLVEAVRP